MLLGDDRIGNPQIKSSETHIKKNEHQPAITNTPPQTKITQLSVSRSIYRSLQQKFLIGLTELFCKLYFSCFF